MERPSVIQHTSWFTQQHQPSPKVPFGYFIEFAPDQPETRSSFTQVLVDNKCNMCQKRFTTEALYHVHTPCYYTKHGIKKPSSDKPAGNLEPFVCSVNGCAESFATLNYLRRHVTHHFPPSFNCTLCDYRGYFKRDAEQHNLVHSKKKDYQCNDCDKAFAYKRLLQEHQRRHLNHKPYKCEWPGCQKTFVTHNNLKEHVRRHKKEKKWECKFCDKKFVRNFELKLHTSRMHAETHNN